MIVDRFFVAGVRPACSPVGHERHDIFQHALRIDAVTNRRSLGCDGISTTTTTTVDSATKWSVPSAALETLFPRQRCYKISYRASLGQASKKSKRRYLTLLMPRTHRDAHSQVSTSLSATTAGVSLAQPTVSAAGVYCMRAFDFLVLPQGCRAASFSRFSPLSG